MNARRLAACAVLLVCSLPAVAQYKWVSPDGTVSYGDRPPVGARKLAPTGAATAGPATGAGELPYALRGPVARYPVTLYGSPNCEPCTQLRDHLSKRGIPFSERRLGSAADIDAYKKLGFQDNLLPALTVGRQRQTGYEPHSVDALLDAAGYPRKSVLAQNWRSPPARDLADRDNMAAVSDGTTKDATAAPDRTASPGAPRAANRLIIPEDGKPVHAAPPLPARSNASGGFRF
jgi:hypothetical protein